MKDYIELPEGFFTTETMKGLRMEENGVEASVIYLKLALMQKFEEGSTGTRDGLETMAEALDEDPDTFENALMTLVDYGLADAQIDGDDVYIKVAMPNEVE